jgi:tRNA(Ile2) C34 agmatinyltransferase TiaS
MAERTARDSAGTLCPDCGRPSSWKGDIHRYRCRECVAAVVGIAYRPADPRPRRDRNGHPAQPDRDARGRLIIEMPTPTGVPHVSEMV